mmetsp:Transcript_64866/g.180578  ORF Transcript_64866/g.180578 Transcript_64866/m.180578 type:complete len:267 (-) Transcript_64866:97-897(-)
MWTGRWVDLLIRWPQLLYPGGQRYPASARRWMCATCRCRPQPPMATLPLGGQNRRGDGSLFLTPRGATRRCCCMPRAELVRSMTLITLSRTCCHALRNAASLWSSLASWTSVNSRAGVSPRSALALDGATTTSRPRRNDQGTSTHWTSSARRIRGDVSTSFTALRCRPSTRSVDASPPPAERRSRRPSNSSPRRQLFLRLATRIATACGPEMTGRLSGRLFMAAGHRLRRPMSLTRQSCSGLRRNAWSNGSWSSQPKAVVMRCGHV